MPRQHAYQTFVVLPWWHGSGSSPPAMNDRTFCVDEVKGMEMLIVDELGDREHRAVRVSVS